MVHITNEAKRSASIQENATSSATEVGILTDQDLSLRFIARTDESGNTDLFVKPSQQYQLKNGRTVHASTLHQEDLFRMATLLMKAYSYIDTLKKPAADSAASETSDSVAQPLQDSSPVNQTVDNRASESAA